MLIEIKTWQTGRVVFSTDADNIAAAVAAAIEAKANLIGADLSRAYLSWADLSGANLIGVNRCSRNYPGAKRKVN